MHTHSGCCGSSLGKIERRFFLAAVGGTAFGAAALSAGTTGATAPNVGKGARAHPVLPKKPLEVQPALAYQLYERREATSWRPWGGLHTRADVDQELRRIEQELQALAQTAEFPVSFRPTAEVTNNDQAGALRDGDSDVMLIYGASGNSIEALISPNRYNLLFVRHKSGPVYLWYEIAHPILLRKMGDAYVQPGLESYDIVVDEQQDLLWRLRAFYALKNSVGSRIVAIGSASGWGQGGQKAPGIAREKWKLDIIDEPYEDLGKRITAARADASRVAAAEAAANEYLSQPGTELRTERGFVSRAFLLADIFQEIMDEAEAQAITVNNCMTTIIPMSETTACLALTLINDAGMLAFCESDFVVIPSGILLHHIASTPVFLQDPTYPHHGVVTLAHCTAPRRMDGKNLEDALIVTHYESDYGAAPKVAMRVGQTVTVIDPDFESQKWIGFRGVIADNPFLDICRTQVDVTIEGDCRKLMEDMRGFHWMLAYGDHLKETGYALRRLGIDWYNLTTDATVEA